MPTDLDDADARRLLHLAADTIDVAPSGPLAVPPHRPWWPALAAAAAVVVATGLAVGLGGDDPAPEPAPPPVAGDTSFRLGPDQVPSVFGYDVDDAAAMLDDLGYAVSVQMTAACHDDGRAFGTEPAVGTIVRSGADVTVWGTARLGNMRCEATDPARQDAWELLDLVGGRGSSLDLAPTVTVYDGDRATTVPAAALATWPTLTELVAEATRPQRLNAEIQAPQLWTDRTRSGLCGTRRPDALRGRTALGITIGVPTDGMDSFFQCRGVLLVRERGQITDLQVVDEMAPVQPPAIPDVVGNSASYATERLEQAGFAVDQVRRPDCTQPELVTAQEPAGDAVQIAVTAERSIRCRSNQLPLTDATRAADDLVGFLRGGPPPAFADTVHLLATDEPALTLSAAEAAEPHAWGALWPDVAGGGTRTEVPGICVARGDDLSRLPPDDPAWVGDGEPRTCAEDWAIAVWTDDAGAITVLDVLRGRAGG